MHIYFSGIGGVGIGPLAMLALDCGYEVSGSDLHESEMTALLQERGARLEIGQDGSYMAKEHGEAAIGWFVYSSALPAGHPELVFAKEHNIKVSKRDGFLNHIIKDKQLQLIAVSGTHGKTTTTGMLIWLFKQLGLPVSYSIGTSISFGPPAQYQPGSKYFIYECDEFDRNFLHFSPEMSLITSLDYDHADTYPTQTSYFEAFDQFIAQTKRTLVWQSDAKKLAKHQGCVVIAEDTDVSGIKLAGGHNRRNAWLATSAVKTLLDGTSWPDLLEEISQFPGTTRRFEELAKNLYTDYAHHPAEIAATISMAKEINPNVVVVYQPHQNIRQHEILKEGGYRRCFDGAKMVYLLPTYLSREDKMLPVLPPEDLIASTNHIQVEAVTMGDLLWPQIKTHLQAGELVVAMSAGDLDHWLRQKVT